MSTNYFDPHRDAQIEGRVGHPQDSEMIYAGNAPVVNGNLLSEIKDFENHGAQFPNILNHFTPANEVAIDNDGDRNEDATRYPSRDENFSNSHVQNGSASLIINKNTIVSVPAVDQPTCNNNPVGSTESRCRIGSNSSTDEQDEIDASQSGFESDDENSTDDDEKTDQIEPIDETPRIDAEAIRINAQQSTTETTTNETHERQQITADESSYTSQTISNVIHSADIVRPKETNATESNIAVIGENIQQ